MTDYTKLVKALRYCMTKEDGITICEPCPYYGKGIDCENVLHTDAAAVIEVLEAEVKRLKDSNDELREKQTYADHNGDKWRTGGKDILQAAYDHGYMDGWEKARGIDPPQEV